MIRNTIRFLGSKSLFRNQLFRSFSTDIHSVNYEKEVYVTKMSPRQHNEQIPTFQLIDPKGNQLSSEAEEIPTDILNKIYETMIKVEEYDKIGLMCQRQGKISFYLTSFGEVAAVIGSAAAIKFEDPVYSQYREQGVLFWRGYTFQEGLNQCTGNWRDPCKGRQMPVHYGTTKLNFYTVSSPLTTQVPQASGAGYALRLSQEDKVAVTYFGEGAASEGDFHAALNFASTLKCQTLFICRNNRYAISTPSTEQYSGDGIAGKSVGYGIKTYRVDGNDALAVYKTTQEARKYIIENRAPAFIEMMTYRVGDHSTSDHSILYRSPEEIKFWKSENNPIDRLGLYLRLHRGRDNSQDLEIRAQAKKQCSEALKNAFEDKLPSWESLFDDVYDKLTPNLVKQKQQLQEHLKEHANDYQLDKFHKETSH